MQKWIGLALLWQIHLFLCVRSRKQFMILWMLADPTCCDIFERREDGACPLLAPGFAKKIVGLLVDSD